MKKLFLAVAFVYLAIPAFAQNLSTVSGSNLEDLNGTKLAAGQICFLGTDSSDNPISFQVGGGGQALRRQYCSPVTAGVITSFTVPNPANTLPSGIYYRVMVKDTSTGVEVLRYTGVTFAGATFNFDNYTPVLSGANLAPLTGNSVSGNLGVTGNITATGTVTGSNIPGNILQQVFSSGVGQTQRTGLNFMAGITCGDNAGTSRTDCRLGTLTTVAFSATPTFDASTASSFKLTLTGNVTSSTLSNAVAGEPIGLEICQNATGGFTFVPPANVVNFVTIPSAPNACIFESFVYDGANALADQSVAGLLISETTNPASSGVIRMASADQQCWRNNANAANDCQAKTGAAGGNVPADTADFTQFGGIRTPSFISATANPSATGAVALASADCVKFRNNANGADVNGVCKNASDQVLLGSGPVIVPAAADTAVLQAATQTLTNKTLTSPALTTPTIGGETVSHAPRFVLYGAREFDNSLVVATTLAKFFPNQPVNLERIIALVDSFGTGCTTLPIVQLTNGTTTQSLTIANSTNSVDSGALSLNFPSGTMINLNLSTVASGCTTFPQGLHVVAQFLMQ